VRFSLRNTSSEAIEIPLEVPIKPDGIVLPMELITGTAAQPALFASLADEKPAPLRPAEESATPPGDGLRTLRLAAHGTVGAQIDFRTLYKRVRYNGVHRLEWRPLGGRIPTASVEFRVEPRKDAVVVTDYGKITFTLMYEKAPRNVENFLELVRDGFYDGKTIHRIIPGYIIQGGCPLGTGNGIREDGKLLAAEFHDAPFDVGSLAMAHKPDDPNSASCQFFVGLGRLPDLDGKYTIIAQARDEASLRTLRQLADLPIDGNDRPIKTLYIRSINLIDTDAYVTGRRDISRP
jgi:cyclophilin family peptidyl-prolyl cis-trans isomerase